jgi:glycolate oxidase iron-sulfur subunit
MKTALAEFIRDTPDGREADAILRNCVHCGFCTATCPTYQLLGDDLDSPRGRIYLMKQVLEGHRPTSKTQLHLDRCLTCRACETTCPSGVHYSRLLDIGRHIVDRQVGRSASEALARAALRIVLTRPGLFGALLRLGRIVRPLLPRKLRNKVPASIAPPGPMPAATHARRMLVLDGCVQPALSPATNAAAARVLDHLGVSLVSAPEAGCCGAVSFHLDAHDEARDFMRRNIDAWWPHVERGAEALVITASGCGVMVKDYGYQLAHDAKYAQKAKRISGLVRDIGEVILAEKGKLYALAAAGPPRSRQIAFHAPCTLQHGLRLRGGIEELLAALGFEIVPVRDAHLCCGSAGTYSLLQPGLSQRLLANKVAALSEHDPAQIVTANIGCQSHLQSATPERVRHWIELIDEIVRP